MKLPRLIALTTSILLAHHARATNVSGTISTDTTWTLAGSPYIVTGSITVSGGATLTIEPGVTVRFGSGRRLSIGSATSAGALVAAGTVGQKVLFTTNTEPPAPGQWSGVHFNSAAIDAVFDGFGAYVSGSILEHCVVEFAGGSACVDVSGASPFINDCEIRYGAVTGIEIAESGSILVTNNYIHHNAAGSGDIGGGVHLAGNDIVFAGNHVSDNYAASRGGGVYVQLTNDNVALFDNTIVDNTSGEIGGGVSIVVSASGSGSSCTLSGNVITGNLALVGGGGIHIQTTGDVEGTIAVQSGILSGNTSARGGGLHLESLSSSRLSVTITACTIMANVARGLGSGDGLGGAIYVNTASLAAETSLKLISSRLAANAAEGGTASGGGVGGGVYVTEIDPSATTTINLAGNESTSSFNTLDANSADLGSAIYNNMLFAADGTNDIQAAYACWGNADPSQAASPELIFDTEDDPAHASVRYTPHVTSPNCLAPPACAGDADGDGVVAFADITSALTNWGFTYPGSTGPGDANHDGVVNFADITDVLTNWGLPCP